MVRDIISYAGEVILTIYHIGFDEEVGTRKIKRSEKIGKYNIVFEEEVVEEGLIDNLKDWDRKIEGLLGPKDIRNPYFDRACAYMIQYMYLDKPRKLFTLKENRYVLNIADNLFKEILLFTKKYAGLDLHNQAMCYGDIFVYECYQRNYYATDEGIIIDADLLDSKIIVNFKNDNVVVCTREISIESKEKTGIKILSDGKWDSFDIQIYADKRLVYFEHNISFMKTIILNSVMKGRSKSIPLDKLGDEYIIEEKEYVSRSIIGKKPEEAASLISESNYYINQRLVREKNDNKFWFIMPNELERARDYIVSILRSGSDDVWIFDPYFSDREKMMFSLDWLRILAYCKAANKHIVFCNNEAKKFLTVAKLAKASLGDRIIQDSKGNRDNLGIHFYQIETYIHDRFIFAVSGDKVTGITVGTSLNSLGKNYFCINNLSNISSRNVFYNLKKLMNDSNIVAQASI